MSFPKEKRSHPQDLSSDYERPKRVRTQPNFKCPICLNEAHDLTLLKTCTHGFCYDCISKWITQRANCPLCKVSVGKMKHHLRAVWDENIGYNLPGTEFDATEKLEEIEMKGVQSNWKPLTNEQDLISQLIGKYEAERLRRGFISKERFKWLTAKIEELLVLRSGISQRRFSRRHLIRHPLFRFVIYSTNADRTVLVKTSTDVDVTPDYVRNNFEALKARITPFVIRELATIATIKVFSITEIVELILNCMINMSKYRSALKTRLKGLGIEHPLTLYNEVFSFVEANQSMKLYDANSRYITRITLGSNFREDDDDVIPVEDTEDDVIHVDDTEDDIIPVEDPEDDIVVIGYQPSTSNYRHSNNFWLF